jgi:GntR family transcriptional regulator
MSAGDAKDMTTDRPLYQRVISLMQSNIRNGVWPVHTKLKDEIRLAEELGVSRGTLRRAIKELIRQGLLTQVKGRGTFVVSNLIEQPLATRLVSFAEAMEEQGLEFTTHVLSCRKLVPGPRLNALLELRSGEKVYHIVRVRRVDGRPIIYLHNYVPTKVVPKLTKRQLERSRLFDLIHELSDSRIDWGRRYFKAVAATDPVAAGLELPIGSPVLFLEQIVYSTRSVPIECSNVWIDSRRFDIVAIVNR